MLPLLTRARLGAALAAAGALVGGALVVQQALPASASARVPAAAPMRVVASPLIQGVVVDQSGRPVDGVKVQAFDKDGAPAASAETYASDREDGPQHGYFFVEVSRGTYSLKLSKAGYKTVELDAGTLTKRKRTISLGEIEIKKVAQPTSTTAKLGRSTVSTKEAGSITVTVSSDATSRPTGDVEVREGRKVVGAGTITKKGKGVVEITLSKLSKGNHSLTAYFLGTADLKASDAKSVTLHVVKKLH